ncbi:MAG TPA: glycoside hydrolase family 28 protein [Verrucomicrobiae bacterium]
MLLSVALPLGAATFNVRDYGAAGDGKTVDTAAIQQALDACKKSGGTVEFPAGTYPSQPLKLRDHTVLQLDAGAMLQAVTNQADFMKAPGNWLSAKNGGDFIPFISGKDLTALTITGEGVIDGNGAAWWEEAEKARKIKPGYTLPRPNLIVLERCQHVRVENLTLQNSPKFHLVPTECEDVVITNVTILAPEHAANTDAIDPSGKRILITHCRLDVGDDNVAIKAGKKSPESDFQSEDITVTDCTFLHGHGMSIGSETSGGVRNVTVRNCTFANTENGLRIKSDVRRGGTVENISYSGITMSNVNPAITLTCVYQGTSAGDAKAGANAIGDHLPSFRNIHISDLTASCPKAAGLILGLPQSCISNVVLENVKITAAKGFSITHAKAVQLKNVSVTADQGKPFVLEDVEVSGMK